jgi:hypothetical protein
MAFKDLALSQEIVGKSVVGLELTNPTGLTLEVAAGSIKDFATSQTHILSSTQSHTFTSHNKWKKKVFMGIISNGTTTDLWIDEFIHDGKTMKSQLPTGYSLLLTIAWFDLLPNAIDFSESVVNRRVYIVGGIL